jgi:hypothetical protein
MKKMLFARALTAIFVVFLTVPVTVQAKRVSPEKAGQLAQRFAESKQGSRTKANVRLKHTAVKQAQKPTGGTRGTLRRSPAPQDDDTLYYVFNMNESNGGGFVIVAADDVANPILGFSSGGTYDDSDLPPNFVYWMDYLSRQIAGEMVGGRSGSGA